MPSLMLVVARRTARPFLLASACAGSVATLVATPAIAAPAGVLTLPPRVTVSDLAELRDGSVAVATGAQAGRSWTTTTLRLGDRGPLGAPVVVDRRSAYAEGAFLPGGELILMRYPRTTRSRNPAVELRDISATGRSTGTPSTFRGRPRRTIQAAPPQVGPTGAVVVQLNQSTARGNRILLAFRPAGAATFAEPALVRSTTRKQARRGDDTGDGVDTTFKLALGPDGGGAVLALPEGSGGGAPYVRRISPTGALGPVIGLGLEAGSATAGALSFDEAGRLVLAVARWDGGSITWATGGRAHALSLAPGADVASPPQPLGEIADGTENLVLHLVALSSGRFAVLLGAEFQKELRLFEGPGPLDPVAAAGIGWRNVGLHAMPDGRLLLTWEEVGDGAGVLAATRSADGTISTPTRLTPALPGGSTAITRKVTVLRDGRVALAWTELSAKASFDRTFATIATP